MTLCPHFTPGTYSFEFEFVLDAYMGPADAVIRCKACRKRYMINLVDWAKPKLQERSYSVRRIDDGVYERFAHNVSREYCDLTRKQSEAHALKTASPLLEELLVLDIQGEQILDTRARDTETPTSSWRDHLL